MERQEELMLLCLSFMKADSTKDQEENLLTVHLCFRNLQLWVLKILSHLMRTTLEYTIQFLLKDLNQYLVLISSSSIFYLVLTTFTSTANIWWLSALMRVVWDVLYTLPMYLVLIWVCSIREEIILRLSTDVILSLHTNSLVLM